ncbi:hypothetical protein HYU09_00175 [Candidatus Woesearchaeota archaeon]|nr:hypothetical protein [Candidatus Woesearchaeota archaeon]
MIGKIKDLMNAKEQIDIIKNNLNYATSSVAELKEEVSSLKGQLSSTIEEISHKNNEFFTNFNENMEAIRSTSKEFEKELFQFKLLKAQMQKKVMEKFEEELGNELKLQTETLKTDAEAYNELKENITGISKQVNSLGNEINKFIDISKNIKKEDFELTRFAHQLREMDKEKLELMRKIDTLERLVSKIRRQEFITR